MIQIGNLDTHELSQTILSYAEVVSLAVSPDGKAIAGGGGKVIWIWDFDTGTVITTFSSHDRAIHLHHDLVYDIAFSLDGSRLTSASRDGTVKLWRIPKPLDF